MGLSEKAHIDAGTLLELVDIGEMGKVEDQHKRMTAMLRRLHLGDCRWCGVDLDVEDDLPDCELAALLKEIEE